MLRPRRGNVLIKLLAVVAALAILAGFLLPAIHSVCYVKPHVFCINNLRHLALALSQYADRYGCYPPAYVTDASGRPAHSWRVLLLPYVDQPALYDEYNFAQPWDGPDNTRLIHRMPGFYSCPRTTQSDGSTSYVAVVGPRTIFPGARVTAPKDVRDGLNATLIVTETTRAIPWTAPIDLELDTMSLQTNDPKRPGISSNHEAGACAAFANIAVRLLPPNTRPETLRAMLTIDGGEAIELPSAP